jgi:hypothetical protein
MQEDLRTKIAMEMLKSINQQAWPMIDDGVPALDVCQRILEIVTDAIGFLRMTDGRTREAFAESASSTLTRLAQENEPEAITVYLETVQRVAADMNAVRAMRERVGRVPA